MDDFFERPIIEPSADLRQAALAYRQLFLSFTETGFTEDQAMALLMVLAAK